MLCNHVSATTGMTLNEHLLVRDLETRAGHTRSGISQQRQYPGLRMQDPTLAVGQLMYVRSHRGPVKGQRYLGWDATREGSFSMTMTLGREIYLVEKDRCPYTVHQQQLKPAGGIGWWPESIHNPGEL